LAITGILLTFYIVRNSEISEIPIEKIDSSYLGKTVTVSGKVVSVNSNKGHIFLTLCDKKCLDAAIFSNIAKFLTQYPKKGDRLIITGVIDEYKGNLQIVPRKASDVKVEK